MTSHNLRRDIIVILSIKLSIVLRLHCSCSVRTNVRASISTPFEHRILNNSDR